MSYIRSVSKNFQIYNRIIFDNTFRFMLIYQGIHPLTTAGIGPLILLTFLNLRFFCRQVTKMSINQFNLTALHLKKFLIFRLRHLPCFERPMISMRNNRRRADLQLARIVGLVVFVFLVLNMPRVCIGVFEFSRYLIKLFCDFVLKSMPIKC